MKKANKIINIIVPIIFFCFLIFFKGIFEDETNIELMYDPIFFVAFFVMQFISNMCVIKNELENNSSYLDSKIELLDIVERIMTSIGVFALVFRFGDIKGLVHNHTILSTLYIVFYFYLLTFSLSKLYFVCKNKCNRK